jgi:hypothetical protein
MEKTALDLIPWQQEPQLPEQRVHVIEWCGGKFEIPKLGYLTADEHHQIGQIDPGNLQYQAAINSSGELYRAIGDEENWPPRRCYALLTLAYLIDRGQGEKVKLNEEDLDVTIKHKPIIDKFLSAALSVDTRVRVRQCTVIMNRLRPGWSDGQSNALPHPLQEYIIAFEQQEERDGMGAVDVEEQTKRLEADLGKLGELSQSIVHGPTGLSSTGIAPASGPDELNSAAQPSDASPAHTSFRRPRRATRLKGSGFTTKSEP